MKRPGYREAIFWIAANDDTEWVHFDAEDALGTPSVTGCLVADLFGVDTERVRIDVVRELNRQAIVTGRLDGEVYDALEEEK